MSQRSAPFVNDPTKNFIINISPGWEPKITPGFLFMFQNLNFDGYIPTITVKTQTVLTQDATQHSTSKRLEIRKISESFVFNEYVIPNYAKTIRAVCVEYVYPKAGFNLWEVVFTGLLTTPTGMVEVTVTGTCERHEAPILKPEIMNTCESLRLE